MSDDKVVLGDLKEIVAKFVRDRDWEKYHNPKNLAMALNVEAAELLEIFQWMTPGEAKDVVNDPEKYQHVKEEIADIFTYLLSMCDFLNIDLSDAFYAKQIKNEKKYPLDSILE